MLNPRPIFCERWGWSGQIVDWKREKLADTRPLPHSRQRNWACHRMPKDPRGEKRPADVCMSVKVMCIATREEEEELNRAKRAAAELGSRGGKARAAKLSGRRKREIAKKAAAKRWAK